MQADIFYLMVRRFMEHKICCTCEIQDMTPVHPSLNEQGRDAGHFSRLVFSFLRILKIQEEIKILIMTYALAEGGLKG